ncbi:hypothetical protein GQ53DRAFT_826234 [Thozetella sp. PMI_491]|nr:hypothetical protein GQ53DRAFT_826234 [Thozetella sp. PMI_491]
MPIITLSYGPNFAVADVIAMCNYNPEYDVFAAKLKLLQVRYNLYGKFLRLVIEKEGGASLHCRPDQEQPVFMECLMHIQTNLRHRSQPSPEEPLQAISSIRMAAAWAFKDKKFGKKIEELDFFISNLERSGIASLCVSDVSCLAPPFDMSHQLTLARGIETVTLPMMTGTPQDFPAAESGKGGKGHEYTANKAFDDADVQMGDIDPRPNSKNHVFRENEARDRSFIYMGNMSANGFSELLKSRNQKFQARK